MEARADKPDSANGLRKVLREMMKVAVKLEWRDDDPTLGVKKIKPKKKGGFHRWTDAEIAKFEQRHPIGSKARLAMALGLYTGQARQDVILMGEQHITRYDSEQGCEVEILNWVRKKTEDKTGLELAIPVHPELRRIIDATPSRHLTFLVTELGAPFTAAGFGNWFRDRCNEAGLYALLVSWSAQGGSDTVDRCRVRCGRGRRHHRPCQPERVAALHRDARPQAGRAAGDGQAHFRNRTVKPDYPV